MAFRKHCRSLESYDAAICAIVRWPLLSVHVARPLDFIPFHCITQLAIYPKVTRSGLIAICSGDHARATTSASRLLRYATNNSFAARRPSSQPCAACSRRKLLTLAAGLPSGSRSAH